MNGDIIADTVRQQLGYALGATQDTAIKKNAMTEAQTLAEQEPTENSSLTLVYAEREYVAAREREVEAVGRLHGMIDLLGQMIAKGSQW